MKNILFAFSILLFAIPFFAVSQDTITTDPEYQVIRVYPSISITKKEIKEAETLCDINRYFEPSWVRDYISVDIITRHNGIMRKAEGRNDTLNHEQKEQLLRADFSSKISVVVNYIPENTLKHNDPKIFDFSFIVEPVRGARYAEGEEQLKQYLKEKAADNIPVGSFEAYQLAAVKFIINEEGQVTNPFIFWSSEDEFVDKILLETV